MLDKQLYESAWRAYREGNLEGAWGRCQTLVRDAPGEAPVWDIASRVALAMGAANQALQLNDRSLAIEPDNFAFLCQQASCLLALKRSGPAIALLDRLAQFDIGGALEHDTLGTLFSQCGDQGRALASFERAVALDANRAHFQLNLGLALQATGALERAEEAFDRAIELDPSGQEAWLHRSRLRSQGEDDNHVVDLQAALQEGAGDWRREMTLRYALAKELEDLARYRDSFRQLAQASGLRRRHMKHDAGADISAMNAVREQFGDGFMARDLQGSDSGEPIFIVGLPRTGTTLVERILGSHSQVFAAGELNNFAACLGAALADQKPGNRLEFIRLSADINMAKLGNDYIDSTRPLTGHTPHFVDKLPLNFLYCGLIARALPRARIIHLSRHPMDTCYAIYKTLFKQAYPFSYDLQELGNYYLAYRELMAHWHEVMPGKILDVQYEQLTENPEQQSRRLIDYCGLDWEPACLEFHRSQAPSMTASLAQVRKPFYTSSIGKWQHYREQLAPLAAILQREGIAI